MDDLVIMCDEVIDVKHINFSKKYNLQNTKVLFYLYHWIIDICQYLLSSDKILRKTKTLLFNNTKLKQIYTDNINRE